MSVTYQPVAADVRFQFHGADGAEILVDHEHPLTTDDPGLIAWLDQVDHVKRAKPASPASEDAS